MTSKTILCSKCNESTRQYCCPRCRADLCGLTCYKTHNDSCLEAFARDQVMADLHATRATSKSTHQFARLLQKEHDLASHDPSVESLSDSPADSVDVMLSEAIKSVRIKPYKPWWYKSPIIVISQSSPSAHALPLASSLAPSLPHPSLLLSSIVQTLYAYILILKLWNGDLTSEGIETWSSFLLLATCLDRSSNLALEETSILQVIRDTQRRAACPALGIVGFHDGLGALLDLCQIWKHITHVNLAFKKIFVWGSRATKLQPNFEATFQKLFLLRCWAAEFLHFKNELYQTVLDQLNTIQAEDVFIQSQME